MGSDQRNAVLAVVLSGLILFGWQYFFAPPKPVSAPIEPKVTTEVTTQVIKDGETKSGPIEPAKEEVFTLSSGEVSVSIDNNLTVRDFKNPQAAFSFENTVGVKKPMQVQFDFGDGFKTLSFVKEGETTFVNTQHDVRVTSSIDEKGVVNFSATSKNPFKFRINYKTETRKLENGQERFFAFYSDSLTHHVPKDEENGDKQIKWAGIDFNYHLFAAYFEKPVDLLFSQNLEKGLSFQSVKAENSLSYNLVFAKKEYNDLSALGHNLQNSVDFGMWGFFAVWILKGLQFFHKFFPNYGVSIILLTIVIRMVTFPLQYKSFASMKKLQLVQPELQKIREKYKDDPARMQKESMELFKKSGANPIGGCLPLLLQMPVFFAFYKVLYNAVELVDAPFYFWLHDLSNKDPYYVLPVLMTGAMFLQQKLTPNTVTDPVQKKVMLFMPIVFGFIMKDLPSGLSLYIFVSTLFGILQQLVVFNSLNKKNAPVVV